MKADRNQLATELLLDIMVPLITQDMKPDWDAIVEDVQTKIDSRTLPTDKVKELIESYKICLLMATGDFGELPSKIIELEKVLFPNGLEEKK